MPIVNDPNQATVKFKDGKLVRLPGREYTLSDGTVRRGKKQVTIYLKKIGSTAYKVPEKPLKTKQSESQSAEKRTKKDIKPGTLAKHVKGREIRAISVKGKMNDWKKELIFEVALLAKSRGNDSFIKLDTNNKLVHSKTYKVCRFYLRQIEEGQFFDKYGELLFKKLPDNVIASRKLDLVKKKIIQLKGNREAIRSVLLRSVTNYFDALSTKSDVSDFIKKDYPKELGSFFMKNLANGNIKSYLMLFYFPLPPGQFNVEDSHCAETYKINKELMKMGASLKGGWTKKQLALFGINYPLKKGWFIPIERGSVSVTEFGYRRFLELSNQNLCKNVIDWALGLLKKTYTIPLINTPKTILIKRNKPIPQ